jgi:glycosyltransferase involved in cell wall biosynthesis
MKILYHHRTQGEEPESVHIANIVAALRAAGHDVTIVGPHPVSRDTSKPTLTGRIKRRLPRFGVELAQLAYNLKSLLQLIRALRRTRPAFIYERYGLYNIAGLIAARWFRLPLILEVNTPYAQAWAKYYGLSFPRLARAVERYILRRADRIITVTEVQRSLLEAQGVGAERIIVCHNAIDPQEFSPERFAEDDLRTTLGLKPLVAGFIGTMNRWQGVQGFAEVVRSVAAVRPDVGFLFVGDGEGRARLQEEITSCGLGDRVVFAGRQPHALVPRYAAAMDIGVLLDSNAYGSPMKVFEYWSMGMAVIAPRVGPVLEMLRDGETGLLIKPGDAPAMAREIIRLAADSSLRQRLGENGRRHVLATHTWTQNAAEILRAYEQCRPQVAPANGRVVS